MRDDYSPKMLNILLLTIVAIYRCIEQIKKLPRYADSFLLKVYSILKIKSYSYVVNTSVCHH